MPTSDDDVALDDVALHVVIPSEGGHFAALGAVCRTDDLTAYVIPPLSLGSRFSTFQRTSHDPGTSVLSIMFMGDSVALRCG